MTKKLGNSIVFLLALLLPLIFPPFPIAHARDTEQALAQIRKARDLIEVREYEAAYKILKSFEHYPDFKIQHRADFRMAVLLLHKDDANAYYDLEKGCHHMHSAAEYGQEPYMQWAFSQLLKKSPYLKMMPQVLAEELYKWNRPGAEKGFAPCQQEMGVVLSTGAGPKTDYVEAYMWLKLACDRYAKAPAKEIQRANRHRALAGAHMAMLERMHLTPEQIRKAVKMARKWEKKHPDTYQVWPVKDQVF